MLAGTASNAWSMVPHRPENSRRRLPYSANQTRNERPPVLVQLVTIRFRVDGRQIDRKLLDQPADQRESTKLASPAKAW